MTVKEMRALLIAAKRSLAAAHRLDDVRRRRAAVLHWAVKVAMISEIIDETEKHNV